MIIRFERIQYHLNLIFFINFNCMSAKLGNSTKKSHPRKQFTTDEDLKLARLVQMYGEGNWNVICDNMPGRNIRQVKERWTYYLSPKINKKPWMNEDDKKLAELYKKFGTKWHTIASFFPSRTSICIRNRVKSLIREKNDVLLDNEEKESEPEQRDFNSVETYIESNDDITDVSNLFNFDIFIDDPFSFTLEE